MFYMNSVSLSLSFSLSFFLSFFSPFMISFSFRSIRKAWQLLGFLFLMTLSMNWNAIQFVLTFVCVIPPVPFSVHFNVSISNLHSVSLYPPTVNIVMIVCINHLDHVCRYFHILRLYLSSSRQTFLLSVSINSI